MSSSLPPLDPQPPPGDRQPPAPYGPPPTDNRTVLGHVVYALYALGFVTGLTPLVGVAIAWFNRDTVQGTWLESHYRWQLRTFWYGVLFYLIGWVLLFVGIGFVILIAVSVWFVWRIAKGWVRLANGEPIEDPVSLL